MLCRIARPSSPAQAGRSSAATVRTTNCVSVVRSRVTGTSTGRVFRGEHRRGSAGVEVGGERSQGRPLVDVGDGDRRVALAQRATRRVAVARLVPPRAKKSESGSIGHGEHFVPDARPASPPCPAGPRGPAPALGGVVLPGRRPGQRLAVDLARGAGRDRVDERQHRDERRGQPLGERGARRGEVGAVALDGQVADQDLAARLRLLDRGRGGRSPRAARAGRRRSRRARCGARPA